MPNRRKDHMKVRKAFAHPERHLKANATTVVRWATWAGLLWQQLQERKRIVRM